MDWYHWKLRTKKEGNCSGRSRERRILLTRIQLLLLQFVYVIWSIPTNFALFQKPLHNFFYKLDRDYLSLNIPCKFQRHWKQGRLLNRRRSNFSPKFEFKSERPHYFLVLFSCIICTCTKFFFLAIAQSNSPLFLYAVFNDIKPLRDEAAFPKLIIFLKY